MKKILQGNEAIARGAWEAGVVVGCAYPGTPSSEIMAELSKYKEIYTEWSPNEKVAVEVAHGASLAGGRAMACMKHVGLNVAADPFMTISYTGVKGGFVIVVADDPGQHSSQNEQDSRNWTRFGKVPMLEPADSEECKEFTKTAFEISERFDTPVLLRSETRVSHCDSPVDLGERKESTIQRGLDQKETPKYVMVPMYARVKTGCRRRKDGQTRCLRGFRVPVQCDADQRSLDRVYHVRCHLSLYQGGFPAALIPEAGHGMAAAEENNCGILQKGKKGDCGGGA